MLRVHLSGCGAFENSAQIVLALGVVHPPKSMFVHVTEQRLQNSGLTKFLSNIIKKSASIDLNKSII
jgi:hypothetical protein